MSDNAKSPNMLKSFWSSLPPKKQMSLVVLGIGCGVLLFGIIGYKYRDKSQAPVAAAERTHELSLDPKLLEKAKYSESEKELSNQKNDLKEMKAQLEQMQKDLVTEAAGEGKTTPTVGSVAAGKTGAEDPIVKGLLGKRGAKQPKQATPLYPNQPPPIPNGQFGAPPPLPAGDMAHSSVPAPRTPVIESIGDIEVVSDGKPSGPEKAATEAKAEDKKKDNPSVTLPLSFTEATLLSGLDAPVVDAAKNNPIPVLLRIKTPAILPNKVKAQLTGCFVDAEGYGTLSDQRVHLRLLTLSCLSKKGEALIEQPVTGYVVDSDSKAGLRGNVVSKMGSTIARSMIAGFFGGVGDAVKSASSTSSVSPLGTTTTIDPKNIAMAGAGQGISNGAQKLQDFYLELAKQTMPIIQVGASRTVTLVFRKGTVLEIKDVNTSFTKAKK